jgi:hypothetical protein
LTTGRQYLKIPKTDRQEGFMAGATHFFNNREAAEAAAAKLTGFKEIQIIEENWGVIKGCNDGLPVINFKVKADGKTLCQDGFCR